MFAVSSFGNFPLAGTSSSEDGNLPPKNGVACLAVGGVGGEVEATNVVNNAARKSLALGSNAMTTASERA